MESPVGTIPAKDELLLDGLDIAEKDLDTVLSIDLPRWQQEMELRKEHLESLPNMPQEIWDAHNAVAARIDDAAK